MKWLGRGPYRVWKNRLKGQEFGVWQKSYNNTVTGESWNYPEFKGYHAQVSWAKIYGEKFSFIVYTADSNMFLAMLRPDREKAALKNNNVEPAFSRSGDWTPERHPGHRNKVSGCEGCGAAKSDQSLRWKGSPGDTMV